MTTSDHNRTHQEDNQSTSERGTDGPLAQQVRRQLFDDILAGELPPGTRLDEISLAERFQVSRTPIREALREMVSVGLATHLHRRGVFVTEVPAEQLREMFEYVAEMEAACAGLAALNMMAEERENLLELHLNSHRHVLAADQDSYDQANRQFHEALFQGAHNRYLQEATLQARSRVAPFRRAQFRLEERLTTSYQEHSDIVLAIRREDSAEARRLVREHLLHSLAASQRYLNQ